MKKYLLTFCVALLCPLFSYALDLAGFYDCSGSNSNGVNQAWSQIVTLDATDSNKIWFSNFACVYDSEPVYGILSEDKTTINIPVGQLIKDESASSANWRTLLEGGTAETAYSHDVAEGGNIVGRISEADGKLVITIESWYSAAVYDGTVKTDFWYGAFRQGVTFTKNTARQEATTPEGVKIIINVVDENAKTCIIGTGTEAAIDIAKEGFITIPETLNGYTVIGIANNAFCECKGVTGFSLPNTVEQIGQSAFASCESVTEFNIPKNVKMIGYYAFENMISLAKITVDPANTVFNSANNCNAIVETATNTLVAGCKTTVIPGNIEVIGISSFMACPLTSINIPASVTTIEDHAFGYCSELAAVNFAAGSNLKRIEGGAFYMCENLSSFVIPDKVEYIGVQSFAMTAISEIVIPASVTKIDMGFVKGAVKAFNDCKNLTSIVVEEGNTVYDSRNNCNAIIETATNTLLIGCKTSFIPSGVTQIGDMAFCDVSLPDGFTIPEGVKAIGFSAFGFITTLNKLTLPEGLESIDAQAFATSSIKELTLPSTLTMIGNYAFYGCYELTKVTSFIQTPFEIKDNTFENYADILLYVPTGTKEAYSNTAGWNKFENILEEGDVPEWIPLGIATLTDNGIFQGTSADCKVYQSGSNPNVFRFQNPYKSIVWKSMYVSADEEYNDYFTLTVLQPGECLPETDITVSQQDLVYYNMISTGYRHPSYDIVIYLMHPADRPALQAEENWDYNKVLSYQESGVPEKVQLAPLYYLLNYAFYNTTQMEGCVFIDFPVVEGTGVKPVISNSAEVKEVGRYSLNGQRITTPRSGLNIIRMSDGTTRKVYIK